jgi:hypothetical protein
MAEYLPKQHEGSKVLGELIAPELTFIYGMRRRVEQPRVVRLHVAQDGLNYNWLIWNVVKDFYSYKTISPQAIVQDSQLKWHIMNGTYVDEPWDCDNPAFFKRGKDCSFTNKV